MSTSTEEDVNSTERIKTEEEKKADEEYLKFVKKAVRLYLSLQENNDDENSPEFIKLWRELETGLEVAQILDSALYENEFKQMFREHDQKKIKVNWNLADIKKFDVGDKFVDKFNNHGIIVGVFKFTIWILFE